MFYDRFVELCKSRGMSPAAVTREIGLNNSSSTAWKRGSIPKGDTLQKLAEYFGVTTDYLLGWDTANTRLHDVGLTISDLAEELAIPANELLSIIKNSTESPTAMTKVARVANALADDVEGQRDAIIKGVLEKIRNLQTPIERVTRDMRQMTEEGQNKVADYAADILPRYRAQTAPESTSSPRVGTDTTPPPDAPETASEGE